MDLKEKNELLINVQSNQQGSNYDKPSEKDRVIDENDLDLIEKFHKKYSIGIYTRCITLFNSDAIAKQAISYILLKGYLQLSNTDISNQQQIVNHLTYELCMDIAQKETVNHFKVFSTPTASHDYQIEQLFEQEILSLEPKQLKEILNKISMGDKAILMMKYQDDMPIEEIAEIVALDIEEVKIRLANAQYITMELKSNLLFQVGGIRA